VKKGVFLVSNIYKGSIQTGHYLFGRAKVNITYYKFAASGIFMKFRKVLVLQKGYATSVLSCTND
jgi:hypothetical protein